MCTGLEIAAIVGAVASTAVTVYGQVEQGKQQKAAADYNARTQENQAAYEQDAANAQAEKIRKAARTTASSAEAQLAASGVKVGEGTSLDISRTIYQESEQDAYNAILSGKRGAGASLDQAALLRAGGENAVSNSYIGSGATILGSAGQIAKGWKTSGADKSGYNDIVRNYNSSNYG